MRVVVDLAARRGPPEQLVVRLPDPEVRIRASSRYTRETVDAALAALEGRDDAAAVEQRAYLRDLLRRKFGG